MKIKLVILTMLCWTNGFSQISSVICGSFSASQKIKIKVFEPIEGYQNMQFYSPIEKNDYVIGNSDSFYYKLNSTSPACILIYITDTDNVYIIKSLVTIFPKDSVHLTLNLINLNNESIIYTGSNAEGHKLFNDINYVPSFKFRDIIDRLNNVNENNRQFFVQDIDYAIKKIVNRFDILLVKSKITREFRDFNKVTFTQILYAYVISKFLLNYKQREVFGKSERDRIIAKFYEKQPITHKYAKAAYMSIDYLNYYYNYLAYKKNNLVAIEPLYQETKLWLIKGKTYLIGSECNQFMYIDNIKERENMWALFILGGIGMTELGTWDEVIYQFNEIFPKSKWNLILKRRLEDNKKIVGYSNYLLQSPISYIDSAKKPETLQALLNNVPITKGVFVDLWASWCAPCIKAFQYNKQLDSFLISNNIQRLYVSLDNIGDVKKWQSAIQKYALGGYHILATGTPLVIDIKKVYGIEAAEAIRIPRYILIDKNKKIVVPDAMGPENFKSLKNQIDKYLLY